MPEVDSSASAWTANISGADRSAAHGGWSPEHIFRFVLDLLIAFYASGLALIALLGGGDLGVVAIRSAV